MFWVMKRLQGQENIVQFSASWGNKYFEVPGILLKSFVECCEEFRIVMKRFWTVGSQFLEQFLFRLYHNGVWLSFFFSFNLYALIYIFTFCPLDIWYPSNIGGYFHNKRIASLQKIIRYGFQHVMSISAFPGVECSELLIVY